MFRSQKLVASPEWKTVLQSNGLRDVDTVYELKGGESITHSASTEVRRIALQHEGSPRVVFIKKYWANSAKQIWSGALRGTFFGKSKARREYENMVLLRQWGLDAPAPVAYGEERRARWLTRSFLISEGIPDPMPLDAFIRDILPATPEAERRHLRRELIERLANYTRKLHERHFVHHDYFWRNIILSGQSLEHFALIDAHKGKVWPSWAEQHCRAKDLATLDCPAPHFFRRSERLRFLLRYRGVEDLRTDDKKFVRQILRLASPMRELQSRRVLHDRKANGAT